MRLPLSTRTTQRRPKISATRFGIVATVGQLFVEETLFGHFRVLTETGRLASLNAYQTKEAAIEAAHKMMEGPNVA